MIGITDKLFNCIGVHDAIAKLIVDVRQRGHGDVESVGESVFGQPVGLLPQRIWGDHQVIRASPGVAEVAEIHRSRCGRRKDPVGLNHGQSGDAVGNMAEFNQPQVVGVEHRGVGMPNDFNRCVRIGNIEHGIVVRAAEIQHPVDIVPGFSAELMAGGTEHVDAGDMIQAQTDQISHIIRNARCILNNIIRVHARV